MTDKDNKEIQILINLTEVINEKYSTLCELENKGKKSSSQYQNSLGELWYAKKAEEWFYETKLNSYEKCKVWFWTLFYRTSFDDITLDIGVLESRDGEEIFYKRILNILFEKLTTFDEFYKDLIREYTEDKLVELKRAGMDFFNVADETIASDCCWFRSAFTKDILQYYLFFLNILMENEEFPVFQNDFVFTKYCLAFVNKEIEKDMLARDFEIPKEMYFSSGFLASLLGRNKNYYIFLKDTYGEKVAIALMENMIGVLDSEYEDELEALDAILKHCLLCASFAMMSKSQIRTMQKFYEKVLCDGENAKNLCSKEIINDCFSSFERTLRRN